MGHKKVSDFTEEQIEQAFTKTIDMFASIEQIDISRMQLQIKYAREVVDAWRKGYTSVIISAPTGFGKSILAFFVSKVFDELYKDERDNDDKCPESAYILTSNKFLQSQYQRDIKQFGFSNWSAMLKGQSNYECSADTRLTFANRPCQEESIGSLESMATKWKCAGECKYIVARRHAIESQLTVFNYSYWLTAMQLSGIVPNYPFGTRYVTIFDECHVLGQIVQDMFSVELNLNQWMRRYIASYGQLSARIGEKSYVSFSTFEPMVKHFEQIVKWPHAYEQIFNSYSEIIKQMIEHCTLYQKMLQTLVKRLPTKDDGSVIWNAEDKQLQEFSKSIHSKLAELLQLKEMYARIGVNSIVASTVELNPKKVAPIEQFGEVMNFALKFQCTNESELVKLAALDKCNMSLFMSATIGNIADYAEQTGIENWYGIDVPQVFNYEESPIFMVKPLISMNWKNRQENMPAMIQRIIACIDKHPNERGIVHTGNYEIMRELEKLNHPRIVTYANSAEKEQMINLLKTSANCVVCGPSLIEGVDLADDLCRFMIWAKVPYGSLADALTKRKLELYKNWYNWWTLSSICQGLGRGVRNERDWCKTYLLDSEFASFFARYKPPMWLKTRLVDTKWDNIGVVWNAEAEAEREWQRMLSGN